MELVARRKIIEYFERELLLGKAKAYSKVSLERPLTDIEANEYKKIMKMLGVVV